MSYYSNDNIIVDLLYVNNGISLTNGITFGIETSSYSGKSGIASNSGNIGIFTNNTPALIAFPSQNIQFAPVSNGPSTQPFIDPGSLLSFNYINDISTLNGYINQNYTYTGNGDVKTNAEYTGILNSINFGPISSSPGVFFTGSEMDLNIASTVPESSNGIYGSISTVVTKNHISGFISAFQNTCNASGSSLIASGYGCRCFVVANTGSTITAGYGIDIEYNTDISSKIDTLYQIYMGVTSTTANITTNYGLYQDNIGLNILQGNTSIGPFTTAPAETLVIASGTIQVESFKPTTQGYVVSSSTGVLSASPSLATGTYNPAAVTVTNGIITGLALSSKSTPYFYTATNSAFADSNIVLVFAPIATVAPGVSLDTFGDVFLQPGTYIVEISYTTAVSVAGTGLSNFYVNIYFPSVSGVTFYGGFINNSNIGYSTIYDSSIVNNSASGNYILGFNTSSATSFSTSISTTSGTASYIVTNAFMKITIL